jgi:aryl-alcohol dehydrogenase-like predicted oxidoreductase
VLAQGKDVFPIPGTKRTSYLEENVKAAGIVLDRQQIERIDRIISSDKVAGTRYADMRFVNQTTPTAR